MIQIIINAAAIWLSASIFLVCRAHCSAAVARVFSLVVLDTATSFLLCFLWCAVRFSCHATCKKHLLIPFSVCKVTFFRRLPIYAHFPSSSARISLVTVFNLFAATLYSLEKLVVSLSPSSSPSHVRALQRSARYVLPRRNHRRSLHLLLFCLADILPFHRLKRRAIW